MRNGIVLLAVVAVLAGCTSFHELKPLYPDVGNPNFPTRVDSLQPTFRWEAAKESGTSYDFIIYEGIRTESFMAGVKRAVGKEIYYRENLPQPEHRVEEPLQPDREYYWTVRTRQGDRVSAWARYDYTLFLGTAYMRAGNQPFIFKTPEP